MNERNDRSKDELSDFFVVRRAGAQRVLMRDAPAKTVRKNVSSYSKEDGKVLFGFIPCIIFLVGVSSEKSIR